MRTRIVLCTGIILCLVGTLAADTTWMGPSGGLWSIPTNWTDGLPDAADKVYFSGPSACILDFEGAETANIDCAGGPLQIVDGGSLRTYNWLILGYSEGDVGENAGRIEVYDGGVLNSGVRFYVGYNGEGHLTVYEGGTVNLHDQLLGVGRKATGNGFVELEGGSLNLLEGTDTTSLDLYAEETPARTGTGSINFRGGTMTLRDTTENQDYLNRAIGDSKIKAYDGVGEVVVDPNETPGRIIIRGVHPLKPYPTDDGLASAGDVELTWVLPDPCQPGTPVPVDVYFGTSDNIGSAETPKIISEQNVTSLSVNTEPKTRYYWAVDTYIGSPADPVWGPVFSFWVDNLPPVVDAGNDIATWLVDGVMTKNLDATVTDDDAYTVQWTVISEPNDPNSPDAVITDPSAEDTSITLSALGEYVLQLEAFDGEYTGSDTLTIGVFSDHCEAAKSLPGWTPSTADINLDCVVDQLDMDILLEQWLECTGLDCPDPNAL